ncbi:hypothetical protein BKA70DRAFT_646894 [Coprinopsis sp. MPI-PUGE-AT-0042]|nr:hypothetical protein BKA70DRAFT_646894 [Coprinopsis sp. MPI-PUGE-AT-0042]
MPDLEPEASATEGCPDSSRKVPLDSKRPGPELPPEVWQQIFERTFLPANLIDCGAPGTEDLSFFSLVIEQKVALMSVCRDWYDANKRYLYEHVDLTRPTQLSALSQSLELWPHNGALVNHFHIRCYIVEDSKSFFLADLQNVVNRMPNLHGFTLNHEVLSTGSGISCCLPRFPNTTIRELQVEWPLPLNPHSAPVLPSFSRLRSLLLKVNPVSGPLPTILFPENLELSELERLELRSISVTAITTVTSWILPSLRQLSLTLGYSCSLPTHDPLTGSTLLLSKHGRHLERLQVVYLAVEHRRPRKAPEDVDLARLCPNLRHLVLYWRPWHTLSHPTVQWVDIWSPWFTCNANTRTRWKALRHELIEEKSFPSLRRVRILDAQFASLGNIPFDIPPWSVQDANDSYEINFLGFTLRHEEGVLMGNRLRWDEWISEDDSDYEYESQSDFSDESLSDFSDESLSGFDEEWPSEPVAVVEDDRSSGSDD